MEVNINMNNVHIISELIIKEDQDLALALLRELNAQLVIYEENNGATTGSSKQRKCND